jgi:hypothetical protein
MALRDTASKEKKKAFIEAVDRALKNKRASRVETGENMEAPAMVANKSQPAKKKQDVTEDQRVEYKLPYYSRRNQSKSEPSQGSHGSDEPDTDGAVLTSAIEGPTSPVSSLPTYRPVLARLSNVHRCVVVLHYLL